MPPFSMLTIDPTTSPTNKSSKNSLLSTPNAPKKNATVISAGCVLNTRLPNKPDLFKWQSKASPPKQKWLSNLSNSRSVPPNPKSNWTQSAISSAPATANRRSLKSLLSSPEKIPRRNWMRSPKTSNVWSGLGLLFLQPATISPTGSSLNHPIRLHNLENVKIIPSFHHSIFVSFVPRVSQPMQKRA